MTDYRIPGDGEARCATCRAIVPEIRMYLVKRINEIATDGQVMRCAAAPIRVCARCMSVLRETGHAPEGDTGRILRFAPRAVKRKAG